MSIKNPFGDDGQSGRIDDIKQAYATGAITQEQYNDLLSDEGAVSQSLTFKRAALGLLLATAGFFFLISNF